MRGPLPNPDARRRNAPTIPTTNLPAGGRKGRVPKCPYSLGAAGVAWWKWAWRLPQACAWSDGDLFALARRARLEDDIESQSLGLAREQRELDDRFGLTPKGMAAMRWKIVDDVTDEKVVPDELAKRRKVAAIDPAGGADRCHGEDQSRKASSQP